MTINIRVSDKSRGGLSHEIRKKYSRIHESFCDEERKVTVDKRSKETKFYDLETVAVAASLHKTKIGKANSFQANCFKVKI